MANEKLLNFLKTQTFPLSNVWKSSNIYEKKYHFDDVMIVPRPTQLTSRSQVKLDVSYVTKHSRRVISGFPMVVANMDTTGQIEVAKALYEHRTFVALHKYIDINRVAKFIGSEFSRYSFFSMGITEKDFSNLKYLVDACKLFGKIVPMINVDVANGYMYSFLDAVKQVRDICPSSIIMAGTVCTPEGVENVIKAGADIARCGIANGTQCLTNNKSGIGYPQFSVAQECGQAANELSALCCSDGGCKSPADVCKAFAAGAHFVMAGTMFAGHDENEGEWELDKDGNRVRMKIYGMSSKSANEKYNGGLKQYRTSEGREGWIDYKGPIAHTIQDIKGGLASCCTYTNTFQLENLHKNVEFVETR